MTKTIEAEIILRKIGDVYFYVKMFEEKGFSVIQDPENDKLLVVRDNDIQKHLRSGEETQRETQAGRLDREYEATFNEGGPKSD